jgi:hypothetical protein
MSTISTVDIERYNLDQSYRQTINNNINSGWLFINLPKGHYLVDQVARSDSVIITIQGPNGLSTHQVPKKTRNQNHLSLK